MITFEGLLVPSITIVLPLGGADLSGVVMLIVVGSDLYGLRAVAAAEADPEPDDAALEPLELEEPEPLAELVELDELPQAARARANANMAMIAASPRASGCRPLRRSGVESNIMYFSFLCELGSRFRR